MSDTPRMRARMLMLTLDHIDRLPTDDVKRVRGIISPSTLRTIEGASRLAWLDTSLQVELNDALLEVLGESRYHDFWAAAGLEMANSGALAGLAQGAMRLLGVSPQGLYKMLPRAAGHVGQAMGEVSVEAGDDGHSMHIVYTGLPPQLCKSPSWALSSRATLGVPLRLLEREGEVEMDASRLAEGEVAFVVRWPAK